VIGEWWAISAVASSIGVHQPLTKLITNLITDHWYAPQRLEGFPGLNRRAWRDRSLSDIAFDTSRSTTVRFCDVGSSRSAAHEDPTSRSKHSASGIRKGYVGQAVRPPPLRAEARHPPYVDANAPPRDRY
jgi:hypothetical protein